MSRSRSSRVYPHLRHHAVTPRVPSLGEAAIEHGLGRRHEMHEVAVPATRALTVLVLSASTRERCRPKLPSLAEIGDGRVLHSQRTSSEVASRKALQRLLGVLLILELHVDVAQHMLADIVAHVELLDRSIGGGEFVEDFLVELVEFALLRSSTQAKLYDHLLVADGISGHRSHLRVVVHLLDQNGLTKGGSVVLSRAAVAVSARSDLKVERTVHSTREQPCKTSNLSSSVPYTRTK